MFGRNLARARERAGLTQQELGRRSGTGQAFVSQLEHGAIREPTVSKARRLEDALGLEPYSLLTGQRRRSA